MPSWTSIDLAIICWLYALKQLRMYLICTGRVHSPMIGDIEGGPLQREVAIRSAVSFAIYGFLVLLVPWPRLLTYVSIVWLCKSAVDAVLGWFGKGVRGSASAVLTEKGRRGFVVLECIGVLIRAVLVIVSAYFFGF